MMSDQLRSVRGVDIGVHHLCVPFQGVAMGVVAGAGHGVGLMRYADVGND